MIKITFKQAGDAHISEQESFIPEVNQLGDRVFFKIWSMCEGSSMYSLVRLIPTDSVEEIDIES